VKKLRSFSISTRSDAGKVYAYEIRILQGFGVGILGLEAEEDVKIS
jgi:hypothetical protein